MVDPTARGRESRNDVTGAEIRAAAVYP